MSKRKLTRQQGWRIEKIQEERRQRAQRKAIDLAQYDGEQLGPEQEGLVIANYGAALDVEATDGSLHRCRLRQNLELLVPGDRIIWQGISQEDAGVVVALLPRRTVLARPDALGTLRPLAANIDQILVVAAPRPTYSTDLIDQYLVAAESTGITPLIVFNKVDLITAPEEKARIERDLERYRDIGYRVIGASTFAQHGLDEVIDALHGKSSVFVGQSGVGKSSLVHALLPQQSIKVGALGERSGLGRHTTSAARYYALPGGGAIIDSPGVREFSLWHMDASELARGFIEFRPYLGNCRFRDCSHRHEPGCALRQAVIEGAISTERLASFLRMVEAESGGRS
jgi:ribosome biogenesis GTPase